MNRVFVIERFIYRVKHEGYSPSEDEIRDIGYLLGQPTKKLNVVLDRYAYVFGRYIEKKCSVIDDYKICIYSWNPRISFRLFPVAIHAFGTIILFHNNEPKEVLAYPINKALSYEKSSEVSEHIYGDKIPREVTQRVDGWQITGYFNPLANRWMFATRYVLHNMYYDRGRLIVENFENIANPYIYVVDRLAQEEELYRYLDRYKGYTFTFVLEGPEPAIVKPPYPLGSDYKKYKLYLLMVRDPSGKLYTWRESLNFIEMNTPPQVELKKLKDLYKEIRGNLAIRSYFTYLETEDYENPMIIELESEYYPLAMEVKYLYDAKSLALLLSEGLRDDIRNILPYNLYRYIDDFDIHLRKFEELILKIDRNYISTAAWEIVRTLTMFKEHVDISVNEISKYLEEGNVKRVVRKTISIFLENKSFISRETLNQLSEFIYRLENSLKHFYKMNSCPTNPIQNSYH
uniref:Uncharacterized protein n=1 Tax=Ignisphaera aggregans TaxID=334771 RepID=A0A7C5TGP3_9CREN